MYFVFYWFWFLRVVLFGGDYNKDFEEKDIIKSY